MTAAMVNNIINGGEGNSLATEISNNISRERTGLNSGFTSNYDLA